MDVSIEYFPSTFENILKQTNQIGFDQLSDSKVGTLLATLAATKSHGDFLELGTGSGLSTAWLLHGMDAYSTLQTIDNDESLVNIAQKHLGDDSRVQFNVGKGEDLINKLQPNSMDFIFADTWPGKYHHLDETLSLLKKGGIYIVDDMCAQENWPEGHSEKAKNLIDYLHTREDFLMSKLSWSTGILICTKISSL